MQVKRTIEEVRALYPSAKEIEEQEDRFIVHLEEHIPIDGRIYRSKVVLFVLKPLSKEAILQRLSDFPKNLLDVVFGSLRNTKCLSAVKAQAKALQKFLILDGPAGVGKSVSAVWYMAYLLHKRLIHNPAYISFVDLPDLKKVFAEYEQHDAYLLDDVIPNLLNEQLEKLLMVLIYHAEKEQKPLIITTNDYDGLEKLFPEPILSRVYGSFTIIKVVDKDLRVKGL